MKSWLILLSLGSIVMFPSVARSFRASGMRINRLHLLGSRRLLQTSGKDKDKNFIDVEIIDNTKKGKGRTIDVPKENNDESGIFGFVKKTAQSAATGLTKLLGRDEETLRRKERTKVMNAEIDRAFKGHGILGGIMGKAAKMVGGMVVNSIADSVRDMEQVRSRVEDMVMQDSECRAALGSSLQVYPPMSTSSSMMRVNGRVQKVITMMMPVQGSAGAGHIQVTASASNSDTLLIDEAIVRLSTGRSITVGSSSKGVGGVGKGTIIDA